VGTGTIGIDDGNIFLNYAHHLAQGQGFVFNTNSERVEGFTSLLWVLICSFFYLLSPHPELVLICFSLILTSLTITIVYKAIKKNIQKLYPQFSKHFFWLYCAFVISIGPSYITWSVLSLMENALWNFLFTFLVILISKTIRPADISMSKKIIIILSGCLLTLTRPEALAWNLLFTVILIWTFLQNKRGVFFPLIYFICFACTAVGLTAFRLRYFGFQFPNTYYAKVSPDRMYNLIEGAKYALSFLSGYQLLISFLFVLMSVAFLYSLIRFKILSKTNNEILPDVFIIKEFDIIALIVLVGFVLPVTTGGDHFGGFRFYQELILLFAYGIIIIVWLFKNYKIDKRNVTIIATTAVVLFFCLIGLNNLLDLRNPPKTQLNFEFQLARDGREMADKLNEALPSKPSVGMIAVGGFGLIYQGNTVDLMGLNNILMGHSPGDRKGIKNHAAFNKDVFYKLSPVILLPASVNNLKEAAIHYSDLLDINNFDNQAMKNVFNDDHFKKLYSPAFIFDKKNNSGFFAFVNVNFIEQKKNDGTLLIQQIYQ
jgi:hypothetical protein